MKVDDSKQVKSEPVKSELVKSEPAESELVKLEPVKVLRKEECIFHTASTFYHANRVSNISNTCNEFCYAHTGSFLDSIPDT
jgi:hypothetical protein